MEEDWDPLARRVPSFGRGLRILLVDHDTTSLLYISSKLESHSFKVTTMELASLAMTIFSQRKDEFDLVMADINMQDMSNLGFIQQVLLMKNHMPIVLMSARLADKVVAEQALKDGACFFLQKPLSENDLRDLWQHVYRKRRSSETARESCDGSVDSGTEGTKEESGAVARIGNGNGNGNDQFREVGSVSRANSWTADQDGKDKQTNQHSGDTQTTECDQNTASNVRKRPNEDDDKDERKCKSKINSQQVPAKGKSPIEEDWSEKKEKGGSALEKRQYMKWTPELHFKFTEAIRKLGDKKASPKSILELMNVPGLKPGHISSHLQKYKAQLRSMLEASADNSLPLPSSLNRSTASGNRRTGGPQFQEQQGSVEHGLRPNADKNNNGVQIAGCGKHQGPNQTKGRRGPLPSAVNENENGNGKHPLDFQWNVALDQATLHTSAAQHCWQRPTQFPAPLERLVEPQNLMAGLNSSANRPNSDIPADFSGASSENQGNAYVSSTGQYGFDESSVDAFTEWLSTSLD